MKYIYYPGCSMERNAIAYQDSVMTVARYLDFELCEIDDWNCCGATEYFSIDSLPAYSLVCRNLALAAKEVVNGNKVVATCSACYLNLLKTDTYMAENPGLNSKVNSALSAGGLNYSPGSVTIHHLLEILTTDIGYERIKEKVKYPLYGLRVAPYYGCLFSRPVFNRIIDDPEYPTSLDNLMRTISADVIDFPLKAHCCGGHMSQISEPVALELIRQLLDNAASYKADLIVTICPMCQLNLDAYQDNVNKYFGTDHHIPVLFFSQLLGLALGAPVKDLGFGKEFIGANLALEKILPDEPMKSTKFRKHDGSLPMPSIQEE